MLTYPSLILLAWAVAARASSPTVLPAATIALVQAQLASDTVDSWVSGTRTEALFELQYPALSVFTKVFSYNKSTLGMTPSSTNAIIDSWYTHRAANCTQFLCVAGGAAGDPASLGVAWILASVSEPARRTTYTQIIQQEIAFLTITTKRTADGAISTRPTTEPVQLWADFVYMTPPFLAYAGAFYGNSSLLLEAYNQCRLYRQYLQDPSTKIWKHVVLGDWQDLSLWSTGNAWAAAGMIRVIATMRNSVYATQFKSEIANLVIWVNEIIEATFPHILSSSLLPNTYGVAPNATFADGSSSALLAATVFRLAVFGELRTTKYVKTAEAIMTAVNARVNTKTGWLAPVVNPLAWTVQTNESPEGEAFVLLLQASYEAYQGLSVKHKRSERARHGHRLGNLD